MRVEPNRTRNRSHAIWKNPRPPDQHSCVMTDPKVSIILRSYNEGWALKETLPALAAQNYTNWELIVVDSGSTDGSVEMIRKAKPAHFEQIKSSDYNPSRVMNRGMTLSQSNYCLFLN